MYKNRKNQEKQKQIQLLLFGDKIATESSSSL